MKSNAQKLRDAAAMIIGANEADILLRGVQDDAVRAFKLSRQMFDLKLAAELAIDAMENMKQGRFRGASKRLHTALAEYELLQ